MEKKLILYGAGQRCRELCKILKDLNATNNLVIVDSNPDMAGCEVEGLYVGIPDKIIGDCDSNLCITIADKTVNHLVREKLMSEYGFQEEQLVSFNKVILSAFTDDEEIKDIFNCKMSHDRENILFDCYNGLGLGGVEAWTMDLCSALIKHGYDNMYIISDKGDYDISNLLRKHVLAVEINHTRHYDKKTVINIVKTIMDKAPCKVVTCTVNEVMLAAYLVKKRCPDMVKVISVIHNSSEDIYADYLDFKECSDMYIGVSEDIKNDMIARGISQDQISVMTCPFECDEFLDREYTENQFQPIRIGYAGRIEYVQKRVDLILKLIERLTEKQVYFVIELAGDGAARKQMEEWVLRNKMAGNVKFLGSLKRPKMKDFWRKQDICVNMADFEGRCISKLEAMANGAVPVITATAGAKEDVIDSVNGYIVPMGDYEMAADKIEYLSNYRGELRKMGSLAHDAVYPKSSMETHLKFWEQILAL